MDCDVLRFVILADDRPRVLGNENAGAAVVGVVAILFFVFKVLLVGVLVLDDADDDIGLGLDFDRLSDRIVAAEQSFCRVHIDDSDLLALLHFVLGKVSALDDFILEGVEEVVGYAQKLAARKRAAAAVDTCAVCLTLAVGGGGYDSADLFDLFHHLVGNERNARWDGGHIVFVVILLQGYGDDVVAGAYKAFFQLGVGALYDRYDADDAGDADDNAQHRQKGAHLMGDNAAQG